MTTGISTMGMQLSALHNMTTGLTTLNTLSTQLTTEKKSENLVDYSASDALKLMNLTNSISSLENYSTIANTVNARVKVYDSTLTSIETDAEDAIASMQSYSTYSETSAETFAAELQGYMSDMTYYLNQTVGDRYVFAGSRYTTEPMDDIANMETVTYYKTASASYDSGALTLYSSTCGTFGNDITVTLSAGTTAGTTKATVSVPGQTDEVFDDIAGTGNTLWQNIASTLNDNSKLVTATAGSSTAAPTYATASLSGGTGESTNGSASVSTSDSSITFTALSRGTYGNDVAVAISDGTTAGTYKVTVTYGTTTETYDDIDASGGGASFWTNVADAINNGQAGPPAVAASSIIMATTGSGTSLPTTGATTTYNLSGGSSNIITEPFITTDGDLPSYDAQYTASGGVPDPNAGYDSAYVQDQVSIDESETLKYGITSTQSGFQKLVAGLRLAYAATQSSENYKSYMTEASSLITQGLSEIRSYHTALAADSSTIETIQNKQATLISDMKSQIDNIQSVDINEVALKINTYQAVLEASYAATAKIINLSILNYL